MKKNTILCHFVFLFLIFGGVTVEKCEKTLLTGCSGEEVSAPYVRPTVNTIGTAYNPHFMTEYFSSMNDTIGYNYANSCNYVAIDMILKYYDMNKNDNIVPEDFDIVHDITINTSSISLSEDNVYNPYLTEQDAFYSYYHDCLGEDGEFNQDDYLEFIQENSSKYFHLQLLEYAYENGYDNDLDFSLSGVDLESFLEAYLLSRGFNFTLYSNYDSNLSIFDFVVGKINSGIPVLLRLFSSSGIGHTVVAYDYDTEGNLYFNYADGMHSHISLEDTPYNVYLDAYAFDITITHECSDNLDSTSNTEMYCVCEIDGTHKSHFHSFTFQFFTIDKKHYMSCFCSVMSPTYHTIDGNSIYTSNYRQYGYCIYCESIIDLSSLEDYYLHY